MVAFRRFVLLAASISAAWVLSACQPATQDNQPVPTKEIAVPELKAPHSEHGGMADDGLTEDENGTDESQMTDLLRDYTRSMTRMHDEMMIGMSYNDPDTAFAKSMLGHHRGAVEMAKIQLKYGNDAAMRQLAQEIIDAQQADIDILNKWLASHPDTAKPKPSTEAMQQAYTDSMDVLNGEMVLGIADPAPDMAFARGMLPHHIGAVEMAKIQLTYGTDDIMRQLAQDIIDTQQAEIERMQNWIAALKVLSDAEHSNADIDTLDVESTENERLDDTTENQK